MSLDYKFNGAYSQRMSEGPGGFSMWVPSDFNGVIKADGELKVKDTHLHKVSGNILFTGDIFREEYRNQQMFGILEYENGDNSKGPSTITMMGLHGQEDSIGPFIYSLPFRTEGPQTYNLGITVKIPEGVDRKEMRFYSGKLFSWKKNIGEVPEDIAERLKTPEGLIESYLTIDNMVKTFMKRAKKSAEMGRYPDELKSDLDMVLFQ